jgi:hypothetical protein
MLKMTFILTIKMILAIIIFFALMSLFITILKTGLLRENSFAIKFLIAFPLAVIWGIISVYIFFSFDPTTLAVPQVRKSKNNNLVKCQVRETD